MIVKTLKLLLHMYTHHFDLAFSLGGGLRGMRKRALIGCMSDSAEKSEKTKGGVMINVTNDHKGNV